MASLVSASDAEKSVDGQCQQLVGDPHVGRRRGRPAGVGVDCSPAGGNGRAAHRAGVGMSGRHMHRLVVRSRLR